MHAKLARDRTNYALDQQLDYLFDLVTSEAAQGNFSFVTFDLSNSQIERLKCLGYRVDSTGLSGIKVSW